MLEGAEAVSEVAGLLDEQVDRLGAVVGDAVGVEAGEQVRLPCPQRAAEPGDLGNRAFGEGCDHFLGDRAALVAVGAV